jgi:oligopeptidase B
LRWTRHRFGANTIAVKPLSERSLMPNSATTLPTPPVAKRRDNKITQLGNTRNDAYSWLKEPAWQELLRDPGKLGADIKEYLDAENAYSAAHLLEPTTKLRETLFAELRGRIKEDDSTVPAPDGTFAYFTRFREGGQYPIVMRVPINPATKEPVGPEQTLLDGDAEGKGKAFWQLGG